MRKEEESVFAVVKQWEKREKRTIFVHCKTA
jgi:hypothetical protein